MYFHVLDTEVFKIIQVFSTMTPCRLLNIYRPFGEAAAFTTVSFTKSHFSKRSKLFLKIGNY